MSLNLSTAKARSSLDRQYKEEADLLKAVIKWLEPQRRDGIKVIRVCDRYNKGYSDLFINVRGVFVVAELKDDEGSATPHQIQFVDEMVECGAIGKAECRTVNDVIELVEEAKRRVPDWTRLKRE